MTRSFGGRSELNCARRWEGSTFCGTADTTGSSWIQAGRAQQNLSFGVLSVGGFGHMPVQPNELRGLRLSSSFVDRKDLATTYSRGTYKTTTIGKTVFDGRVRDGNGSDHSFMATKKYWSGWSLTV